LAPTEYKVNLDALWRFSEHLSIALMTVEGPSPAKIRFVGAVGDELVTLTEFYMQGSWAPVLFVPKMQVQREAVSSILVLVESLSTGQPIAQQVVKLSNPATWNHSQAKEWLQLVERKFINAGSIDPHSGWIRPIRNSFAPGSRMHIPALLSPVDSSSRLMGYGFSIRDLGLLAAEVHLEAVSDTLSDYNEFCVRKPAQPRR
jgi:hypothetical protein